MTIPGFFHSPPRLVSYATVLCPGRSSLQFQHDGPPASDSSVVSTTSNAGSLYANGSLYALCAVRFLLLTIFVALAGCTRAERLSAQAAEATGQIQRWVAVGATVSEARRVMEQRGFTCSLVTNGTFDTLRGLDCVYCDRREGAFTQRRWQAALVLVEGRVSAVHVATGLVAP